MHEPQAYVNGRFIPASQATLSVTDGGFIQGTTVAEQLRTFGGKLFQLPDHLARLWTSLAIVGIEPPLTLDELARVANQLVEQNYPLLPSGHDLGLTMFFTPGHYAPMGEGNSGPTVCLHTFPLRFELWAEKYQHGESLVGTTHEQVPEECWPRRLKCRSRMHYYLADREAQRRVPGSRALMCDRDGFVTETATANIVLFRQVEGLLLPPSDKVLPGISLAVLLRLGDRLQIVRSERDLTPQDVATSDEVLVTSTSPCVLPVVRFNGQPIGPGTPGPVFRQLLAAWSDLVGLDIEAQAARQSTSAATAR